MRCAVLDGAGARADMRSMPRLLVLAAAALALSGGGALAQGVAPGGPIGNSTGIGSGLGNVPGGTGPSWPNGTTAPTLAPPPPPGGATTPSTLAPPSYSTGRPSAYPQPRDPFDGTVPHAPAAATYPSLGVPLAFPARAGGDVSFMKGCWRSGVFRSGGHAGTVTWCLDDKGVGRFLYARTGQANFFCHARAEASYDAGLLRLHREAAACTDGSAQGPDDLDCRSGKAEAAECAGDGVTVRLYRVR